MEDRPQQIIIKKVKKAKGGGAHGGSWKVAYADFVTAMMAFFLLLWLLSMVSDERRAAVSEYFLKYSIFQESGSSALDLKDSKATDPRFPQDASGQPASLASVNVRGKSQAEFGQKRGKQTTDARDEDLVKKIRTSIDDKMAAYRDQVLVDVIEGGIRVQVIDADGSMMFPLGSAKPTQRAREILQVVADNMNQIPGKIVVEGHTDAAPFRGGQVTNWELSTSRASAARRVLEESGTDPTRIARVVGYADQELLLPLDPRDQRNRRISIIVLHPEN
jgi:chemotaxis protein MotB